MMGRSGQADKDDFFRVFHNDMHAMTQLLRDIFNHDFTAITDKAEFSRLFFAKTITSSNLRAICAHLCAQTIPLGGKSIPGALLIKGKTPSPPLVILAQVHGNEPAGLAGILLAMALSSAGLLERDVIAAVGNTLAATQYFESLEKHPHTRQETRDAYRCGLSESGALLPDLNRIPVDFLTRDATDFHTLRARELYTLTLHACGILDIHTARGNMLCITDHKHDAELKNSPIRALLTGLPEAIAAHASAAAISVQTFKTIVQPLPNIKYQVGIEAGRHEAPDAPYNAANFTLSMLHTIGWTQLPPLLTNVSNIFEGYAVHPKITYADLNYGNTLLAEDRVYMARTCQSLASVPERSDTVIVKQDGHYTLQTVAEFTQKPAGSMEYALFQYDEMEAIDAGQVVAVALPSGTEFRTRSAFSGIFLSKSAALYDKDPAVGPWPVAAAKIAEIKFCYPCTVGPVKLNF